MFFLIILIILFLGFNQIIYNSRKNIIQLPVNVTTVFLGNSTVETSINDTIYNNSFNFARSGEILKNVYSKLKLIHKYNPQIDTVFAGFDDIILDNITISSGQNNLNFFDQFNQEDHYNDLNQGIFTQSLSHLYDIKKIGPNLLSYFSSQDIKNLKLGGFQWLIRDKLNIDTINKSLRINLTQKTVSIPEINLYYLKQIKTYCKNNNLKLYFLMTPRYKFLWGDNNFRFIHQKYFSEIEIIDCMNWVFPDSCYADMAHLNHKGADFYSKKLNNFIRNKEYENI